ncbi:MAG TPA: tetratricopeptide repeat protein [Candidatus Acidoferrales bacterium]|nr:tetratricopeptide repeat protein [Candidatus Acidoferrales bacterium]
MGPSAAEERKRWAIFCLAVVVSATIVYQAAKLSLAWYWENSGQTNNQIRAAKLTPTNAQVWAELGEGAEFGLDEANPIRAIPYFVRAVHANPLSATQWIELANAYEATGDVARATEAYENARRDYPISADVAWKYGNFLLRRGQTEQGLSEIHRALLNDPKLTALAMRSVWNFDPDVNLILDHLLPADEDADFVALDFFVGMHQIEPALEAWKRIVPLSAQTPIELKSAFPLLDELIARDRVDDAQRVWRAALEGARWPAAAPMDHSIVWNGGFETPIANGGLDWRVQQPPGAYTSVDPSIHHSGEHSLRVGFTGGVNVEFVHVFQIAPAQPDTTYDFQAFVRTEGISTDKGIQFEVFDPQHEPQVYLLTPGIMGTMPWTPVRAVVSTSPMTRFLEIRLHRFPSRLFDSKISGTIWIDDVTLVKKTVISSQSKP